MDEMRSVKYSMYIKRYINEGLYGFKNINKDLSDWLITDIEEINPLKKIMFNKKHFIWYNNNIPSSILVYKKDGKKEAVSINVYAKLYKLECKDYYYVMENKQYYPYVWLLDMAGKIYFVYRRSIDEVFSRKTESLFSRNEDIDSYINSVKNKEYFSYLITDLLSKEKVLKEHELEYKDLRKKIISSKESKESIYGIYKNYEKIKKSNKYSLNILEKVDKILTNIDDMHYDINYKKQKGRFYFTLGNLKDVNNINIKVFENFINKSEICNYKLRVKPQFYSNANHILEAINNIILWFTPINEEEGNYDSIK